MTNLLDTLKQLGPARLGIMGAVVLGLMIFFVFVSMRVSTPDLKLLYSDLSSLDSSSIAAKLEDANIAYSVSEDGSKVMVSETDVGRARMLLAQEGLPNGGSMGYEIFDKQSGFGTTNFVQNVNQVRALQGELSRTISSLDPIRSARVHLVLPQRELFSRDSRPASASVFIGLRPGSRLEHEQILAVQSLVASAVPGLKPELVSLVDSDGNLLARGEEESASLMTAKGEEMRKSYEVRLTSAIEDMVSRVVGFGKVRANVTADLNFDKISTNEELYDPEGQVARSTQVVEENNLERDAPPDGVSVENNLPGIGGDLLVDPKPALESSRIEETTNYEVSKTIRTKVSEVGEVKKLSIAVLVDGTYITEEDGTKQYQPRPQQELDQIYALVKSAVGYDQARGDSLEVINMQFVDLYETDTDVDDTLFGFEKADLLDSAEVIVVAIMIVLVVLLVLQPMVGRLLTSDSPQLEDDDDQDLLTSSGENRPALAAPGGPTQVELERQAAIQKQQEEENMIDMQKVEGQVKASSIKKVEDIVETYPNEAVSVIRSWMSQDT